jgi:hypothetical protein
MEQTKSYVKLYIIPADEYQSNTSLNHPVSVPPFNSHPQVPPSSLVPEVWRTGRRDKPASAKGLGDKRSVGRL